jgi:hypothetical protein
VTKLRSALGSNWLAWFIFAPGLGPSADDAGSTADASCHQLAH